MPENFEEFLRRREVVSGDYIRGDASSLAAMLTDHDPATFLPPSGAAIFGAEPAAAAQIEGAKAFGSASTGRFEILNSGSSDTLGYWTGRQHATMQIEGQDELVPMVLRTTEIFRLEDGEWKLVHRHADVTTQTD